MKVAWKTVKLRDVLHAEARPVNVQADEMYRQIGIRSHGRGVFHKEAVSGFDLGNKKVFWMEPGDFVINIVFGWEGAIALLGYAEEGMIGSHRFPTFRADEDRLDSRFLLCYCKTHAGLDLLGRVSPGGAGRNRTLSKTAFLQQEIPLPPLAEQRRIVARIEALVAQLDEARRLRKEAVAEAGKLLFAGCEKYLKDAEAQFSSKPLIGMCDPKRGISYGIVLTGSDTLGGIPTLRAGDLQWHRCRTDGIKRVAPEAERSYTRTRLQGGELLLRIRGGVGAVAVCPNEMKGGNVSREIAVIPFGADVDSRYAMFLLSATTSQERMSKSVKGTSYVGLNLKDVRELHIPIPPLPEQRRIVAELDVLQEQVNALKRLQSETATELDALLPAILDRAFKGEL